MAALNLTARHRGEAPGKCGFGVAVRHWNLSSVNLMAGCGARHTRIVSQLFCVAAESRRGTPHCRQWPLENVKGREFYPYVRTLGGISLFDFNDFDPESHGERRPISSWRTFIPFRSDWGCSVRIEKDREQFARHVISAPEPVAKWELDQADRCTIMPYIDAAHLGLLPRPAFTQAFPVPEGDCRFRPRLLELASKRLPNGCGTNFAPWIFWAPQHANPRR